MAQYNAVDPMVRALSQQMLQQQQQQEEQQPGDQASQELMARLQNYKSQGPSKPIAPLTPLAPNTLGQPSTRPDVTGSTNQLNEIAKWGQYSVKPKVQPQSGGGKTGGGGSDFQSFMRAIASQESGGNYRAVNRSSGALGKYQIMPANVGPWSQKALGRRITPQQFLNNPTYQEQIAQYMLRNYYQKYGARGAAEAWYGGPGSIGKGYVRGYSNSILRKMGL